VNALQVRVEDQSALKNFQGRRVRNSKVELLCTEQVIPGTRREKCIKQFDISAAGRWVGTVSEGQKNFQDDPGSFCRRLEFWSQIPRRGGNVDVAGDRHRRQLGVGGVGGPQRNSNLEKASTDVMKRVRRGGWEGKGTVLRRGNVD